MKLENFSNPVEQPLAVVMLSSFNGELWIAEQIHSILSQTHKCFRLMIRDDGSTDSTPQIVSTFLADPRISFVQGDRIGFVKSFQWLLDSSPAADVYLYCDQDDIWLPQRIERTVGFLEKTTTPTLYGGAYDLFGPQLRSPKTFRVGSSLGLGNAIVQSRIAGCVSAFNRHLRDLLIEKPCPDLCFHDHWAYVIAAAFGALVVDNEVVIKKRLHGANTSIPAVFSARRRIRNFLAIRNQPEVFDRISVELLKTSSSSGSPYETACYFLRGTGCARKVRLIFGSTVWRFPLRENVFLRVGLVLRAVQSHPRVAEPLSLPDGSIQATASDHAIAVIEG